METIYHGGAILTMEGEQDRPQALLVRDGRIAMTGSLEQIRANAGGSAKLVDLGGKCLMPGFIDPHSHISTNGQMALFASLGDCRCFEDLVDVMKRHIAENKLTPRQVAVGFGYDHNFLEEQTHPGREVLDRISADIPVFILHVSGHLGCGNSAMLALAGITAATPDPQGGRIGREEGSSQPNGYLEEAAMLAAQNCLAKRIKPDLGKILRSMQQDYLRHGVTTAQDGGTDSRGLTLLKLANLLGVLKLDVVAYPLLSSGGRDLYRKNAAMAGKYRRHLKLGGYKMILDGSPQGRSAWLSRPYLGGDDPNYCGYPWLSDREALDGCRQALADRVQLLTHCNGDAASQQLLDCYEKALEEAGLPHGGDLRPVMIHCQTVRTDQLDRMARLNMIASIFVGHVYYWGDVHMKNLGPRRGSRISPVREAMDRGLTVNFHQDAPITRPDMLHSVWAAVSRMSRGGNVIGADQKVSVYEALKAVTINAAYQYFEEDSKGSLRAGKRADLVVLDRCPLDVEPDEIRRIRVLETIKDGKTIYRA